MNICNIERSRYNWGEDRTQGKDDGPVREGRHGRDEALLRQRRLDNFEFLGFT